MKYNAFISYSQRQDARLASCLETALEKFAKPTFKRRALDIFRDSNDLSASPDLWGKIEEGLDESEYFILLASPKAAQSPWCTKEVDHWLKTKSIDKFLVVLTEGELHWDEEVSDFDWETTTNLPKNLSGAFKNAPLYVDFRGDTPDAGLTLEHPDFKDKVIRLAATLHGKAVGDMVGEAAEQYKRTMRIRNAAITVLSVLLIAAIFFAFYAFNKKIEADNQRDIAEKQRSVAESETRKARLANYISASQAQLAENPTISLRLAEFAYLYAKENKLPTGEASEQLIKVFYSGYGFYQQDNDETTIVAVKEEERGYPEEFELFIQKTKEFARNVPEHRSLAKGVRTDFHIDTQSKRADFIVAGGDLDFPLLYDVSHANKFDEKDAIEIKLEGFGGFTGYIRDVALSSDGRFSLLGATNGKTALIDNNAHRNDYNNADEFKTRYILKSGDRSPVSDVGFSTDDQYVVTVNRYVVTLNSETHEEDVTTTTHLWKREPFPYIELLYAPSGEHPTISVSKKHSMFFDPDDKVGGYPEPLLYHAVTIRDQKSGAIVAEFPESKLLLSGSIIENKDKKIWVNNQGLYDIENDLLIKLNSFHIGNTAIFFCFSLDGDYFKINYGDVIRIFALDPDIILARMNDREIMGEIATLSEEDKRRFLIDVD